MPDRPVRILIYQDSWGGISDSRACDCAFEVSRDRSEWETADALVFHLPQLGQSPLPPRKRPGQIWVALCVESAVRYPLLAARGRPGTVFDLWMTYQRNADVWCPYFSPETPSALTASPAPKLEKAPAVAFISSIYDRSGRTAWLTGLMRHMPVDSYGRLHRNRTLENDEGFASKQQTIARYRFTLAFENAIDPDYVTEKFFDPLAAGSVPVYLGAPNIAQFAPGDDCFIDATRFGSPRALAEHLMALAADDRAYARYLRWKAKPLRPAFLKMVEEVQGGALCRLARLVRPGAGRVAQPRAAPMGLERRSELPSNVIIASHPRSGTHFLINALSRNFGFEVHQIDSDVMAGADFYTSRHFRAFLDAMRARHTGRLIKDHHHFAFFSDLSEHLRRHFVVFYLYRNPADTMCSYWRYVGAAARREGPRCGSAGEFMRAAPADGMLRYQMEQHATVLDRWRSHVDGWTTLGVEAAGVVPIRYEDLNLDFDATLARVASRLGMACVNAIRPSPGAQVMVPGAGKVGAFRDLMRDEDIAFIRQQTQPTLCRLDLDRYLGPPDGPGNQ